MGRKVEEGRGKVWEETEKRGEGRCGKRGSGKGRCGRRGRGGEREGVGGEGEEGRGKGGKRGSGEGRAGKRGSRGRGRGEGEGKLGVKSTKRWKDIFRRHLTLSGDPQSMAGAHSDPALYGIIRLHRLTGNEKRMHTDITEVMVRH